jgi:hypothetical protein
MHQQTAATNRRADLNPLGTVSKPLTQAPEGKAEEKNEGRYY